MASTIKTSSDLYHQILDLKSLQPGPEVNEVFTQLVKLCLTSKVVDLVKQVSRCDADFKVNDLVCKCLQAEELMEKVWAKRIASGEAKVSDFWYYQNYVDITAYETQALISSRFDFAQKQEKSCEVVFIGSGSLPLTAFLLAQSFPNIRVTLIDREAEAHQLARAWMEVADGEAASRIRLVETDFFDCQPNDFKAFDVVYLAASIGSDEQRQTQISAHLASLMRPGAWLAARTAEGACQMLYHAFPEAKLSEAGFVNLKTYARPATIVNNVIVGRKADPVKVEHHCCCLGHSHHHD